MGYQPYYPPVEHCEFCDDVLDIRGVCTNPDCLGDDDSGTDFDPNDFRTEEQVAEVLGILDDANQKVAEAVELVEHAITMLHHSDAANIRAYLLQSLGGICGSGDYGNPHNQSIPKLIAEIKNGEIGFAD